MDSHSQSQGSMRGSVASVEIYRNLKKKQQKLMHLLWRWWGGCVDSTRSTEVRCDAMDALVTETPSKVNSRGFCIHSFRWINTRENDWRRSGWGTI